MAKTPTTNFNPISNHPGAGVGLTLQENILFRTDKRFDNRYGSLISPVSI